VRGSFLANIPAWAKKLIEKHYGACGLGEEALKLVERPQNA
jgi:hypothetical protein